jgi:hypothetical protein
MACTIDATAGGETANSYATIAEADTYHETHPYPDTWVNADDDQKCRTLQTATRLLDQWYEWDGIVSSEDQALLWPRQDVIGPHGYLEDSEEIPIRVVQATAELARQLLDENRTEDSQLETQGLTSLKAGSVELKFKGSVSAKVIPDAVAGFVGVYGKKVSPSSGGSGAVDMFRG